ncbi:hypothetical protein BC332_16342 [Capsicum chinense]|nr:hypothetical protein BC332_16342 [Capsicum chinense]
MDRISQLPDPVLQHILFFLPAKDAALTSVLSKTWLRVWNLLPISTFDFDQNDSLWKLLLTEVEESKEADIRDGFQSVIDDSLINLRFQKAIIEKFRLSLKLSYLKNASCIDEWIRLATNNCIKELDFYIKCRDGKDWYSLPGTTFTAKSLMVLRLGGFKLEWPLIVDHINLTKLRELSLTDVFLEERIILEICSACPAIEDLSLIRCRGVKDLLISDLPKLLKLTIHQANEIQPWKYRSRRCNSPLEFDLNTSKLLKELSITFEQITDSMVENLVSELPLLEKLELNVCLKLTKLKFSSRILRHLAFRSGKSLMKIEIDTPNLHHFEYGAPKLPVIFSMMTSSLQESYLNTFNVEELNGTVSCPLSVVQHVKIKQVMESVNFETLLDGLLWTCHPETLSIERSWKHNGYFIQNTFNVEELNGTVSCPLSVVQHVKIKQVMESVNFETLLDGLLWTCHPETLSIERSWKHNGYFIQVNLILLSLLM